MRFEPRPDADVRGEAPSPEGVEGVGRKVTRLDFLKGMILRDTPMEYRLRPRKRAAIDNASTEIK